MALYLLHRDTSRHEARNSAGVHSCIVSASSEAEARRIAKDRAFTGEVKIADGWLAVRLAEDGRLPVNPIYFRGDAIGV